MSGIPPDPPPFAPFPIASSEPIYDSHWCRLRRDFVELDDGTLQEYHVFDVPSAVVVVPVLPDGSIVFLWQFRHPHGETHWELPAGRIDEGEDPAAAATRELAEETGHAAGTLTRVTTFYPINGISPHHAHVFIATDCVEVGPPKHDPAERMSVHVMPSQQTRARLLRGDFMDGFTQIALFQHFARCDGS